MFGNGPIEIARSMSFPRDSKHEMLRQLVIDGFFNAPVSSSEIARRISEKFGRALKTSHVQTYARKFMEAAVLQGVRPGKEKVNYYVLASMPRQQVLAMLGKEKRILEVEHQLFSHRLMSKLERSFSVVLTELQFNFGRHGIATAFLLRKILEKLLIIVFGKVGKDAAIADAVRPGGWKGLQDILEIAAKEKIDGLPLLSGKTASAIKGVKFLGDSAAHNPLASVDMTTILPQMPFIITAYEELARHL